MEAIIFIVRTLLQVLLVTVFLLRVLLPLVRARTQWVYVDLDSRRPLRVPAELIRAFTGTGTTHPGGASQTTLR